MKITLQVDTKDLSRLITGLRKIISDNESLLRYKNLGAEARYLAEKSIHDTEKLIKRIEHAHAAQTLQYTQEGDET